MAFSNKRKVVISKGDSFKKKETEIKSLLRKNEGEDDPENIKLCNDTEKGNRFNRIEIFFSPCNLEFLLRCQKGQTSTFFKITYTFFIQILQIFSNNSNHYSNRYVYFK